MTVEDLIEILSKFEKDAKVFVCVGNSYFELRPGIYTTENEYSHQKALVLDVEI
jgi:predicted MPP superfamily phosphohydrolase